MTPLPLLGVMQDRTYPGADHLDAEVPLLTSTPFEQALEQEWDSDAHFICYRLNPEQEYPRLNKAVHGEILAAGVEIETTCLVLDYDLPEHRCWEPGEVPLFLEALAEASNAWPMAWAWTAWYSTTHGCRFIYVLDEPLPPDLAEQKHKALCTEFIQRGIAVDTRVSDWTRIFRLPKVVRDKQKTSELESFDLLIQPDARLPVAHLKVFDSRKVQSYAKINKIALDRPTPEEAHELLWTPGGKTGKWETQTEFYKTAKRRLKGRECWPCIFEAKPMAAPGHRDATIHAYVGQATSLLLTMDDVTPAHIYALFLPSVEQFEPDKDSPDWTVVLWDHVQRLWGKEEAKHHAKVVEEVEAATQAETIAAGILQGMREWCDAPILHGPGPEAWAWAYGRLILTLGSHYSVMQPNGYYSEHLITANQLIPRIKALGLDEPNLIQTQTLKKDGTGLMDKTAQELVNTHGAVVAHVRCEPQKKGGIVESFDSHFTTLVLPTYRRNPNLEPEFNSDVDEWLQAFFGVYYEAGKRWLGWALAFEEGPICALSIKGGAGIGKKMLVQGLAECLERPALADVNDMVTQYQYGLRESPFLVVNEGWPQGAGQGKHPADQFRALVSGDEVRCNEKYKAPVSVVMLPRIIFTANNEDVVHKLTAGRNLSPEDRDALAARLLHMNLGDRAARWLEDRGNAAFTGAPGKKWIASEGESDFILAKHLMYLYVHRGQRPNSRFLVQGNAGHEIIFSMQTQSGHAPLVIEAIIKLLDSKRTWDGLAIVDGHLYITIAQVLDYWRTFMGTDRERLTANIISGVFRGLAIGASSDPKMLKTRESQGRKRWYEVDIELLQQVAMRDGWRCKVLEELMESRESTAAEMQEKTRIEGWMRSTAGVN